MLPFLEALETFLEVFLSPTGADIVIWSLLITVLWVVWVFRFNQ